MKQSRLIAAAGSAVLASLVAAMAAPTAAQEAQKWHGKAAIVTTSADRVKVEDRANHMVSMAEWDGAVFNGDGKPFLDKARYQVAAVVDTQGFKGGYKTFTEADASKVFAKFLVTAAKPPVIDGTFEFTGGTGKYQGITGHGTFHLVMVSDKAAVDELTGEYTLPAKTGSSTK